MCENPFRDWAIDSSRLVAGGAREFARFAVRRRFKREQCGTIDGLIAEATRDAFRTHRAHKPMARDSKRGFIDKKREHVDRFAGDARIASDRTQPLDRAKSLPQALST